MVTLLCRQDIDKEEKKRRKRARRKECSIRRRLRKPWRCQSGLSGVLSVHRQDKEEEEKKRTRGTEKKRRRRKEKKRRMLTMVRRRPPKPQCFLSGDSRMLSVCRQDKEVKENNRSRRNEKKRRRTIKKKKRMLTMVRRRPPKPRRCLPGCTPIKLTRMKGPCSCTSRVNVYVSLQEL